MEHFDALAADPDLVEQVLNVLDSPLGVGITFQVMAGTFQSACHHNAIGAVFECPQRIQHV